MNTEVQKRTLYLGVQIRVQCQTVSQQSRELFITEMTMRPKKGNQLSLLELTFQIPKTFLTQTSIQVPMKTT